MKTGKLLVLVLLLATAITACGDKKKSAIDFGEFDNGVYTNSFFDLRVKVPDSWFVMDDEARVALMKQGSKIVSGDNKNLQAVMNATDLQSVNLLTAYEHAPGSPVDSNASLFVMGEKVSHMPGLKRGSDYHFHTQKLMQQSALAVSFPTEVYESSIDGISFDVLEIKYNLPQGNNYQMQYCTIMKDYALLLIITFQDERGRQQLEDVLEEIKLN